MCRHLAMPASYHIGSACFESRHAWYRCDVLLRRPASRNTISAEGAARTEKWVARGSECFQFPRICPSHPQRNAGMGSKLSGVEAAPAMASAQDVLQGNAAIWYTWYHQDDLKDPSACDILAAARV